MAYCSNCGNLLKEGGKFCSKCGKSIESSFVEAVSAQNITPAIQNTTPLTNENVVNNNPVPKKKSKSKIIIIGSAVLSFILITTVILSTIFIGFTSNKKDYVLYIKDKELFYSGIDTISPNQITSKLIEYDDFDPTNFVYSDKYMIYYYTTITHNDKIFYIDKHPGDVYSFSIYYRDLNSPETAPIKIDSEIDNYYVNTDGTLIVYTKDNILYQHNLVTKDKLASDVYYFVTSPDCKTIGYLTKDDEAYYLDEKREKQKIDVDISSVEYITSNYNEVYYIRENTLYKKSVQGDKTKIANNVEKVLKVYDSGEIYYLRNDSSEQSIMKFIDDDKKLADASLTKPTAPSYSDYYDLYLYDFYLTYDEMYDAYSKAVEEYNEKYAEYSKKIERDSLRSQLNQRTMAVTSTLYYYDGNKEIKLSEDFNSSGFCFTGEESVTIAYQEISVDTLKKPKLSEYSYYWEVESEIKTALGKSSNLNIACKDNNYSTNTPVSQVELNNAGNKLFYITDISNDNHGDLYCITIKNNTPNDAELYDENVYISNSCFISNDKYAYFKSSNDKDGDLYINKNLVDYDCCYTYDYNEESDTIVYFTNYSSEKQSGTLKVYDFEEITTISEDVYKNDFIMTNNGKIVYLRDYNTEKYRGTLYVFKDNESIKIDDDVMCIIPTYD